MKFKYSVIIPTVGNSKNLSRLLKSLTVLDEILRAEILIVLNPPGHSLNALLGQFPSLQIQLLSSEAGVNRARNVGLDNAKANLVFFLDDDCWISQKDFLVRHEQAHLQNPWALAVGGFYSNRNVNPYARAYGQIQRNWLLGNQVVSTSDERTSGTEIKTLLGGHFSLKKERFKEKFDPKIRYGGSETEFFLRLSRVGFRFLLIDLAVEHEPNLNLTSFVWKAHLQGKTHRRLVKEGYFQRSEVTCWNRQDFYHSLYRLSFHHDFLNVLVRTPLRKIRSFIKAVHHEFWFYISNRKSS